MKVGGFRRISQEDFKEDDRALAGGIANSVNPTMDDLINALSKKLTIDDNLAMEYRDITLSVKSDNTPSALTQFKVSLFNGVRAISVEKVINTTNSNVYLTGAPFITWSVNNNLVTILHVTGLVPNYKYTLTLLSKS